MGRALIKGNEAIVKGALLAGCRSFYGYPITPASEIAEAAARYFPRAGGTFVQAESEIAAINMVYGAAAWPEGSRHVFCSESDIAGSFAEVTRHGVWWELGRRHDLPAALDHLSSPALGTEAAEIFEALLPIYERIAGETGPGSSGA